VGFPFWQGFMPQLPWAEQQDHPEALFSFGRGRSFSGIRVHAVFRVAAAARRGQTEAAAVSSNGMTETPLGSEGESVWARLLCRCRALYHKTRVLGTGDKLPAGRLLFQRPRSLIATSIFFFMRKSTRAAPIQVQRKYAPYDTYSQLQGRDVQNTSRSTTIASRIMSLVDW
jgi:hypothetical protein